MLEHPARKKPLSARKRAAIMANLAKARAAPRTAEGRARSSRNATRHGMFVRDFDGSIQRLGEDRRQFLRLGGLLARVFLPRDATEWRLVRRLVEVTWRHFRVYRAVPAWTQRKLTKQLGLAYNLARLDNYHSGDFGSETTVRETEQEAYQLMLALVDDPKFLRRRKLTLNEVERTLRLLLMYRSGNPKFKFHFMGRRYKNEFLELSSDPRNWPRRYAAAAPVK